MNRIVYFEIKGKSYPLVATFSAVRELEDRYGGFSHYLEAVKKEGLTCRALLFGFRLLSVQGFEYVRVFRKDLPVPENIADEALTESELAAALMVSDIPAMVDSINNAYIAGIQQEISAVRSATANTSGGATSGKLQWYAFICVQLGIPFAEYHLLTLGEIQDFAMCKAIQSGAMEETDVVNGEYLPDWD